MSDLSGVPPPQADRVRDRTPADVNARIDAITEARVREAEEGGPFAVRARRAYLDREWDVDRALMANFALVGGATFARGVLELRRRHGAWNGWLTFFSVQLGFLLWHATRGWCPPLPVFRRLGFRTAKEIAREREALDALAARGWRRAAAAS